MSTGGSGSKEEDVRGSFWALWDLDERVCCRVFWPRVALGIRGLGTRVATARYAPARFLVPMNLQVGHLREQHFTFEYDVGVWPMGSVQVLKDSWCPNPGSPLIPLN